MQIRDLIDLLARTPVVADMHPVSRCYLSDEIQVEEDSRHLIFEIDSPSPMLLSHRLILDSSLEQSDRLPRITCEHNPFTPELNTVLFDRYDCVASSMLCQSQIASRIVTNAQGHASNQVVLLYLIDGLSYRDIVELRTPDRVRSVVCPCLVDVPTSTELAFPNIIGQPPLAMRLFDLGYQEGLGISYWSRDDKNNLTEVLYRTIPRVEKIGDFPKVLATVTEFLSKHRSEKTYIQILRTGLDGYVHHQKRRPPIKAVVDELLGELAELAEVCMEADVTATLYMTSDHGILWSSEFEPELVGNAAGQSSARWCTWKDLYMQDETGRRFVVNNREYYCLGYPKLRRPLRIDEQGVHGGISFQESVVPFVTMKVSAHA